MKSIREKIQTTVFRDQDFYMGFNFYYEMIAEAPLSVHIRSSVATNTLRVLESTLSSFGLTFWGNALGSRTEVQVNEVVQSFMAGRWIT